jgi:UPF0755 protein
MQIFPNKYILVFTTFLFFVFFYVNYIIFVPVKNFPVDKIFLVEKDEVGESIFNRLETEGFIKSAKGAKIVTKVFGYNKFYPGEYKFEKPLSIYEIVYSVTKRPISYAVLIPPGFTKQQIADRLANYIKNFKKNEFLDLAKEGYLYPETYYFFSFSTNEEILAEFNKRFYSETFKNLSRLPTKDEVIVASILEREARDPEDMKIIAGIYKNRLSVGMPLQVDATVLYGKGIWKSRTTYNDLKHDSDYNTYQNKGLPPGPISNPGLDSLRAAMNPKENDYMYYLTGKDGKMYYSTSYEEHVKNKRKYLR